MNANKTDSSKNLKKIIINILWLYGGSIFKMSLSLFVGIWMARYLGVTSYGLLSYSIAFALLFRPIARFGIEGICVRELVKNESNENDILGSAFLLTLLVSSATSLIVVLTIYFYHPNDTLTPLLTSIIAISFIFFSFDVIDYWFQSKIASKKVIFARSAAILISSALKIVGIKLGFSIIFFALVTLIEAIIVTSGFIIIYSQSGEHINQWKFKIKWIYKLIQDCWPLALAGVAQAIYMRIDKIMIGNILSHHDVGIYTAATKLAECWYFLPMSIVPSIYPSIVRSRERSRKLYNERLQQLYNLMTLLGYVVAICTVFLARPIIQLTFGSSFIECAPILTLYIWAGIFINIGVAKGAFLKTENLTKIMSIATLFGALVNVGLNIILIPRFGGLGAAWATIISYSIEAYWICFFFKETKGQARMITKSLIFPNIKMNIIKQSD